MALQDVYDNLTLTGYSSTEEAQIKAMIKEVYDASEKGRALYDQLAKDGLEVVNQNDAAHYDPDDGKVYFDITKPDNEAIVDSSGTARNWDSTYVLTHEIGHALTGDKDVPGIHSNHANGIYHHKGDYLGENERNTNAIMEEVGRPGLRVSYGAAASRTDLVDGTNYTQGNDIDVAVTHSGKIYTDHGPDNTDDLIIDVGGAFSAGDLRSGNGNDFIHARVGNDRIEAGRGNDWIDAGDGNDRIIAGEGMDFVNGGTGLDQMDYSSLYGPIRLPFTTTEGLEVKIDGTNTQIVKVTPGFFLASDPKTYQLDTLEDVEHITGSSRNDAFTVENLSGNMYISGGRGDDTLTVKDPAGAYSLDMTGGVYPAGHPRAGESYTDTVSDGTNTLYLEDKDLTVTIEAPVPPTPTAEKSAELGLEDAIGILATDQKTLNQQVIETGISTPAHEAINHPDAFQMIGNLHAAGVSTLKTRIQPNMDIEDRVGNILNAGRDATQEAGLLMPHEQRAQEAQAELAADYAQPIAEPVYEEDHSHSL